MDIYILHIRRGSTKANADASSVLTLDHKYHSTAQIQSVNEAQTHTHTQIPNKTEIKYTITTIIAIASNKANNNSNKNDNNEKNGIQQRKIKVSIL